MEDFQRGKSSSPNSDEMEINKYVILDLIWDFDSRKKVTGDTVTCSFNICPATMSMDFLSKCSYTIIVNLYSWFENGFFHCCYFKTLFQ